MGDKQKQALRVQFDGKLKLEFQGAKITSDAGLLAFRDLNEAFRLTERGSTILSDPRHGKNTRIDRAPRWVTSCGWPGTTTRAIRGIPHAVTPAPASVNN